MRATFATLILTTLTAQTSAPTIQGEWRCIGLNIDGKRVPLSTASQIRLTVDAKHFTQHSLGKELERLPYQILPKGVVRFEATTAHFLGRYELKEGKLRLAYPGPLEVGKEPQPPADFEPGPERVVSTWERAEASD